ncbi:ABC transporter permease [Candidatus Saccharibacteria bacterium]|nr:ABC transporter permease [Candidatus Saccharibacteria bacterium]
MRVIDIIKDANRNLWRSKMRSFLTILAIFVGSFAIITTTAIQAGVNDFIDSQVASFGGDGFIQITSASTDTDELQNSAGLMTGKPQKYDPDKVGFNLTAISQDKIEKVKQIEGIDAESILVSNFGVATYVESVVNSERYTLTTNILPRNSIELDLVAGDAPRNDSEEYEVALPDSWPEALGYETAEEAVGKELIFAVIDDYTEKTVEFRAKITGILAPSVITSGGGIINSKLNDAIYEENSKYLPEKQKSVVYALAGTYDYKNYDISTIKEKLEELKLSAFTVADIVGRIKAFFDTIIIVFDIFGVIALIAASIGIINTLLMSVQERTREIGLSKALGMSSKHIFLSFSIEAALLGFWGSVCGTIASMLVGKLGNYVAHQGSSFLASFPTFQLVKYPPQNVVMIILVVMLIAFLAGTLPARKAAKKNPIEALRYE